jgi:hypothetical protein
MTPDSPLVARISLGTVAALALSIPLAITLHDAHELALLEKTQQLTDGSVTRKNCENHGKVAYSYVAGGHVYKGSGTLLGKSCEDVEVGESINIIYSAEKPQLSTADSLDSWQDKIFGKLFALAVIGLAAMVVIFRITRVDIDS